MDTKKQMFVTALAMAAMLCISFTSGVLFGCFVKGSGASSPVTVSVNVYSPDGSSVERQTVTVDAAKGMPGEPEAETEKEEPEKQMVSVGMMEKANLRLQVEKDEADYGDNYREFTHQVYTRKPDRIVSKIGDQDGFHIYEETDKHYEHLLEVAEDRMFWSTCEDYNLWCFTPDSVDTMMASGDQYIIFDYDNDTTDVTDPDFQRDLVFRFSDQTRLYRLALYLSYQTELISRENLPKEEFAADTTISGYAYMHSNYSEYSD